MNTQKFVDLLRENPNHTLQFELADGKFIEPTYHITEIKNVTIDSVDCGGNPDAYKQTVIQLWVNPKEKLRKPWTTQKAIGIFDKVQAKTPSNPNAELFFEYGDTEIRTSHFSVENVQIENGELTVQLFVKPTVCKPSLTATETSCC